MPKLLPRKRSNLLYRHKYHPPIRGTKREKFPVSFSLSFLLLTQNPAFLRALYTSDRIYRLLSALKNAILHLVLKKLPNSSEVLVLFLPQSPLKTPTNEKFAP